MKTAVVVGAGGNIGTALQQHLSMSGYLLDKKWLTSHRPDVRELSAFDSFPDVVDLAVYVAGINNVKPVSELTVDEWNEVLDVNLGAAFRFAKHLEPALRRSEAPHLVFLSSIMVTHPYPNRSAYAASKGGLEAFSRSLAVEWGEFCTTYALRLGHVSGLMKSTRANPNLLEEVRERTPSGMLLDPKLVASFIVSAHSSGHRQLNAAIIDMDHGYTVNRWPLSAKRD